MSSQKNGPFSSSRKRRLANIVNRFMARSRWRFQNGVPSAHRTVRKRRRQSTRRTTSAGPRYRPVFPGGPAAEHSPGNPSSAVPTHARSVDRGPRRLTSRAWGRRSRRRIPARSLRRLPNAVSRYGDAEDQQGHDKAECQRDGRLNPLLNPRPRDPAQGKSTKIDSEHRLRLPDERPRSVRLRGSCGRGRTALPRPQAPERSCHKAEQDFGFGPDGPGRTAARRFARSRLGTVREIDVLGKHRENRDEDEHRADGRK